MSRRPNMSNRRAVWASFAALAFIICLGAYQNGQPAKATGAGLLGCAAVAMYFVKLGGSPIQALRPWAQRPWGSVSALVAGVAVALLGGVLATQGERSAAAVLFVLGGLLQITSVTWLLVRSPSEN